MLSNTLPGTTSCGDEPAKTEIGNQAAVSLPTSSPEKQGISPDAIREFIEAADQRLKAFPVLAVPPQRNSR
jgi:hypothetical protein